MRETLTITKTIAADSYKRDAPCSICSPVSINPTRVKRAAVFGVVRFLGATGQKRFT